MPGSELFHHYLNQCFDRLLKSLQAYPDSRDNKFLFRSRVSIKKIRTCLACIEFYFGKNEFRAERHQLRKIFRSGGKLRELHLFQAWFRKHHLLRLPPSIHLNKHAQNKDRTFIKAGPKMITEIEQIRRTTMTYTEKLSQDEVYNFYVALLPDCMPLLTRRPPGPSKWHSLRKRLKQILYARHWQDQEGQKIVSRRQAVYLDNLQHLFGYWHDNEEMKTWLKEQHKKYFKKMPDSKRQRLQPLYRKAIQIMEMASKKYATQVNRKLRSSGTVLQPLENRLGKIVI